MTTERGAASWLTPAARIRGDSFSRTNTIVAVTIDTPAGDRVECRRAQGVSRAKTETGVVPRTPDRVADDQSVGERTVVVRAMRADGEVLVAAPDDDDLIVTDMARDDRAVGNLRKWNTGLEVEAHSVGHSASSLSACNDCKGASVQPRPVDNLRPVGPCSCA